MWPWVVAGHGRRLRKIGAKFLSCSSGLPNAQENKEKDVPALFGWQGEKQ
jgi:hypothetical protein